MKLKRVNGSLRKYRTCLALGFLAFVFPVSALADPQKIVSVIDANSPAARGVSQRIFDFKELGQKEVKSSALLMEELRRLGFTVTRNLKVPIDLSEDKDGIAKTALRAELLWTAGPNLQDGSPFPASRHYIGVH